MLFKNITLIADDYTVRENQYLLTEGQTITYIGDHAPADYQGDTYDGKNKALLPGFYNTHCHVPMVLLRGYGDGLPLHRWLHEKMFPFEALLTPEDMRWGTFLGMAEMMASGVVSFTDMYMEHQGIFPAVDEAGMKANLCHGITSGIGSDQRFVEVSGYGGTSYLLDASRKAGHDRIIADAGIHAEYTSDTALIVDIVEFAKEHKMRIHLHLSETKKEHNECKTRRNGMTPAQWFESLGVFDLPTNAAHAVWIEDGDFDILAKHGVSVAHCPSSNLKLGSGIANIRKMLEKGILVGIGTDGAASNNNLNMAEEITLAAMVQKGAAQDPTFLSTADLLRISTANGAMAQGRENSGRIAVGNRADLIVYDLDKPHLQPLFDLLSNIFYAAQASDIVLTMIDGKIVYKDGEHKTIDVEQAKFHAGRIAQEKLEILNR